jgi:hypothetical protein
MFRTAKCLPDGGAGTSHDGTTCPLDGRSRQRCAAGKFAPRSSTQFDNSSTKQRVHIEASKGHPICVGIMRTRGSQIEVKLVNCIPALRAAGRIKGACERENLRERSGSTDLASALPVRTTQTGTVPLLQRRRWLSHLSAGRSSGREPRCPALRPHHSLPVKAIDAHSELSTLSRQPSSPARDRITDRP